MKITYKENPLETVVELDENEKKEFWYKIKIEEMEELLFEAHFYLNHEDQDIERAKSVVNPDYYFSPKDNTGEGSEISKLDKRVDDLFKWYIDELQGSHCGDCTCVACSCPKCHAESLLGIDTIKGLHKHEASKIDSAFRGGRNIDQVIAHLEAYEPKADWVGWEVHVPRWKKEAEEACKWLKVYRDKHFSNEL